MAAHKRLRSDSHSGGNKRVLNTFAGLIPSEPNRLLDFLVQHEQHYPIFDRICSYLGVDDIILVSKTCKRLSSLYQTVLKSQWNVDHALRRFVKNPQGLRSQIARCHGLIARSFATQFFARVVWPDWELDIYFMPFYGSSGNISAIGKYLVEFECYALLPGVIDICCRDGWYLSALYF